MKFLKSFGMLAVVLLTVHTNAQTQNFLEKPYLETAATYTTEVTPDQIFLSIQIKEKDTRNRTSIEALENKMIEALKSLGIDTDAQLSVADLSSDFKTYLLKKTDVLKTKAYILVVNDAKTLAQIAYKLEQIEISNIRIQKTEYSKLEELKIEMREKAILKAKRQAESMLKPLNQNLGKALFISDTDAAVNRLVKRKVAGINGFYRAEETQFDITDLGIANIRVQIAVTVFFEIL